MGISYTSQDGFTKSGKLTSLIGFLASTYLTLGLVYALSTLILESLWRYSGRLLTRMVSGLFTAISSILAFVLSTMSQSGSRKWKDGPRPRADGSGEPELSRYRSVSLTILRRSKSVPPEIQSSVDSLLSSYGVRSPRSETPKRGTTPSTKRSK